MKKLLVAAIALTAPTGYAMADITMTGDARMGVVHDGEKMQFSQRARLNFNLSGETDGGLEFGATFRADQAPNSASGGTFGSSDDKAGTVWISGAFGRLTMGKALSATEQAFSNLSSVGFSGLGDIADIPYINGDGSPTAEQGPAALYSYTSGGYEFHLGMTDGSLPSGINANGDYIEGGTPDSVDGDGADTAWSVAAAYSGDTFKVGLGYLDNGDADENTYSGSQWIGYGSIIIGAATGKAYYSTFDDYSKLDGSFGFTIDYSIGATKITTFVRQDDLTDGAARDTYGLGLAYDLGGGVLIRSGILKSDALADGNTVGDFGIRMNF